VPPLRFLLAHTQGFLIGCLGLRRLSERPVQVGLRGVEPLFLVAFPDQASVILRAPFADGELKGTGYFSGQPSAVRENRLTLAFLNAPAGAPAALAAWISPVRHSEIIPLLDVCLGHPTSGC